MHARIIVTAEETIARLGGGGVTPGENARGIRDRICTRVYLRVFDRHDDTGGQHKLLPGLADVEDVDAILNKINTHTQDRHTAAPHTPTGKGRKASGERGVRTYTPFNILKSGCGSMAAAASLCLERSLEKT